MIDNCDVINNQSVSCNQNQQDMQNNSPNTTMSPVRQITMETKSNMQNNSPKNTMSPVRQIANETQSNLQNSPKKKMPPVRQTNSPAKSPKNRSDLRLSGISSPVTWKNFSPTKERKPFSRGNSTSSSSDSSPGKSRGPATNKNQMMTWKDVSPTKSSDGSPTNGFGSSSNSFSANENEVLRIELVDQGGRQIPERAFIMSPEDTFNNDYYYDEDFIVQFDTNLRETPPAQQQPTTVKDASVMIEFPQMLTGSYLSFNNMRGSSALMEHEQILKQYESELSGSRNSAMEMSSSEREMMCSSDMLDFSNDPLFTPTPTSEIASHNVSTDSLDRMVRCHGVAMSNSRTSTDGNLGVNCCPKKEEYFLSFEPSQSPAMMSDTETSQSSGPVHWMESQSSGVSGEDLEVESSDSFQFCYTSSSDAGSRGNRNSTRNIRSHGNHLEALVERSPTDEIHSPNTTIPPHVAGSKRNNKPQHFNPKLSPIRRQRRSYSAYRKPANSAPVSPPKHSPLSPSEHTSQARRPKNLMSWRKVQSLRKLGRLENFIEKLRCCSMPNLALQTWQNVAQQKSVRKMNDIASSFHSKRHSASLLELYQRLRSDSNPVSPETMCNVDQILFNPGQGQACFDTILEEKFLQACEKALKTVDRKRLEYSNDSSTGSSGSLGESTIKALEWRQLNKLRYKDAFSQGGRIDGVSKETVISPDTVTLWCGTRNVGSQFPPNTVDCAIQTSIDLAKTSESTNEIGNKRFDRAQQTSLDATKQELLSMLPDNFASLEELLNKIDPKPKMRRHKSCPSEMCKKNINRSQSADRMEKCLSVSGSSFYSHQSLPDLSFLSSSSSTSVVKDIGLSLFDPMQIPVPVPVFIKPKTEINSLHSTTSTQSLQSGTKKGPQSNRQDSKCHCRSKSAPPRVHAHHLMRNNVSCAESASSSSGFSTSSTSSGIDPGYSDTCKCQSTNPSDLERLLFLPPHVENTQSVPGTKPATGNNETSGDGKMIRSKPKFEQYAFESYPGSGEKGKVQMRKKENSVSTSSSSSSMHLENLYSLKEEKTPESSPERTFGENQNRFPYRDPLTSYDGLRRRRWSEELNDSDCSSVEMHNFMYCQSTQYLQQFCYDRSSIPHYDKKPLKSCLRKTARAFKSRSMSDPFNLDWEHEAMKSKKRHSFACDEVYVLPESDHMSPDEGENLAEPVMFYVDQNGDCHMTEQCDVMKPESTIVETDDSDKETSNKRKSVSFASEVSFHAISPQSSPKRQMTKGGNLQMDLQGSSEGELYPLTDIHDMV